MSDISMNSALKAENRGFRHDYPELEPTDDWLEDLCREVIHARARCMQLGMETHRDYFTGGLVVALADFVTAGESAEHRQKAALVIAQRAMRLYEFEQGRQLVKPSNLREVEDKT